MIRYTKQAFRTNTTLGSSANITDFAVTPGPNNQSVWSLGATLLDVVTLTGGSPTKLCRVQSLSMQCYLTLTDNSGAAPARSAYFGKLGKLLGGMFVADAAISTSGGPTPWAHTMLSLPADPTLVTEIWNPANDPLPPLRNVNDGGFTAGLTPNPNQTLPVSGIVSPPIPVDVPIGQEVAVGLWMTPSLIGCTGTSAGGNLELTAFSSTFTIAYDDGT